MKKKTLIISALCACLFIIASGCGDSTQITNPTSNKDKAIKLYTEDAGLTWEAHNIQGYENIPGICSFSYDLSTFSIIVDTVMSTGYYGNTILKTSDFGKSWNIIPFSPNTTKINDISNTFTDGKGFCIGRANIGDHSAINITTDNGSSWSEIQNFPPSTHAKHHWALDFGDESSGIIIPEDPGDSTLITSDGGLTWISGTPITNEAYINDISFLNSTIAVVCGNGGRIFRTTDAGSSWSQITSPTTEDLNSIDFKDQIGVIVGNYGTILRTTDGGLNWIIGSVSSTSHLRKVYLSDLAYWACGDNIIIRSYNIGNTWSVQRNVTNEYYKDLFFIKNAGFVVGRSQ